MDSQQTDVFASLRNDFNQLTDSLYKDVVAIQEQIKTTDNQTWRRLYIKSIFSIIEAQVSHLRFDIIKTGEIDHLGLSDQEEEFLMGKLKNNGERGRPKQLAFLDNVVFTLELFAEINYAYFKITRDCEEWNQLSSLVKIRNRITHPKTFNEINISEEEIKLAEAGFNAFQDWLTNLMDVCLRSLQARTEVLQKQVERLKSKQS